MRWFASSSTGRVSDADDERALLPPALVGALSGLALVSAARRRRTSEGPHPAIRRGPQEEFFQHRPYVRGDDLRAVDWRASARTGHPLLKERHQPSRRPLTLLVDTSASMAFPEADSKLRQAKVLAACLAFLALRRGDSVEVFRLEGRRFARVAGLKPAARSLHAIARSIGPLTASGEGDLAPALESVGRPALRHGLVVLLSDLYGDPGAVLAALSAIRRTAEVAVVHVLAPGEKALPAGFDTLEELEGGRLISLPAAAIRDYAARVARWRETLSTGVRSDGGEWIDADSSEPAIAVLDRWLGRIR